MDSATWACGHDERTIALAADLEPWADKPTRIAPGVHDSIDSDDSDDSDVLDAHALFADLQLAPLPMPSMYGVDRTVYANGAGLALPTPSPVMILARPEPRTSRRDVATVRSVRSTQAQVDAQRSRLLAVVICGSLALMAALAACIVYVSTPHRSRATPVATAATLASR